MAATIHTLFRNGIIREALRPAVAALGTDELLAARALIDEELGRRVAAEPGLTLPDTAFASAPTIDRAFAAVGGMLRARHAMTGSAPSIEIDHRGTITAWSNGLPASADSATEALALLDDMLVVKLPRARARELVAAE